MRILRAVSDYWPCVGGNERWSLLHDHWFSEVAGDEVRVVVLRPAEAFEFPGYAELLKDFRGRKTFQVPQLPKVRVYQETVPAVSRLRLAREYWRKLRPHVADSAADLIITQISNPHIIPCWRGKPVVYEPPALICPYGSHQTCRRSRWMCRDCFRKGGLRWWIRDQMLMSSYSRFDLIVHNESAYKDLRRVGLESRHHCLRFIIDPSGLRQAPSSALEVKQKQTVDDLAAAFPCVLFQFNRLFPFKNPHLLLDVAERLPECAVVFAGDGPDKEGLERRALDSVTLKERVRFLGPVNAACLASMTEKVSAFVLTSALTNYNTSLCESMSLGRCPVVAVDTKDFPPQFDEAELILRTDPDPARMALQLRELLRDRKRSMAIAEAGRRYIRERHSIDQMWNYRERLLRLAASYNSQ